MLVLLPQAGMHVTGTPCPGPDPRLRSQTPCLRAGFPGPLLGLAWLRPTRPGLQGLNMGSVPN